MNRAGCKIFLNGNKDYIEIFAWDVAFRQRLIEFQEITETIRQEFYREIVDFKEEHDHEADHPSTVCALEGARKYREICEKMMRAVDYVFGEGCCKKAFPGVMVPDLSCYEELLLELLPAVNQILEEYDNQTNSKIMRFIIQPQDI